LKRVFKIDVETCRACGGALRVIACSEDPEVITKILNHLNEKATFSLRGRGPAAREPGTPATGLV